MTNSLFDFSIPLVLTAGEPIQGSLPLRIELRSAAASPSLGEAGKQAGDITLSPAAGTPTAIVSLGKPEKINAESFRRAGGLLARWLIKNGVEHAALDLQMVQPFGIAKAAPAFLEGLRLGAFRFERRKSNVETRGPVTVSVYGDQAETLVAQATAITNAVILARDWGQEPANVINPITLAERARELASRYNLRITVLDDSELAEMGAGALTAVGRGSSTPSRMIVLEYPGRQGGDPVVLVGKAITFDTGGYSLKSVENIRSMKYDKMGGITVMAAMAAAAELEIATPIVGIVCAAENMISGIAYRPDDILTTLSGKTVEILTTDAEGRLVLADGLTYAQRNYHPRALINLATLTGGVVTALGRVRAGIMSNNRKLTDKLAQCGDAVYERLWELPLDEEYFEAIKGDDADIKNSGGREAHPIMGGMFLKQFVDGSVPWAHLDIAGTADTPKDLPYAAKGATGFGVRLLVEYFQTLDLP